MDEDTLKFIKVKEGKTTFTTLNDADRIYDSSVFYNPKMTFNRDLTLLQIFTILKTTDNDLVILEPLAGCGVRSYRILTELPDNRIKKVVAGDINSKAIELIQKNIDELMFSDKLFTKQKDALETISEFLEYQNYVDIIDLDPFGSPISFIDLSLNVLKMSNGYLFATSTDLQVLCGKFKDACLRLYNANSTRSFLCHEIAIRILLYNMIISAGRIGIGIKPLISYQHEHFIRTHVQVVKGREYANKQHKEIGFIYLCDKCSYFEVKTITDMSGRENCPSCGNKMEKTGPMWIGQINDIQNIQNMLVNLEELDLPSSKKILKLLSGLVKEINDIPMFYYIPFLVREHIKNKERGIPIIELVEKLNKKGLKSSRTVFDPQGIKTEANYQQIVDILNE